MTSTRTTGRAWRAVLVAALLAVPVAVAGGSAEAAPTQAAAPVRLTGIQRYQRTTLGTSSPESRHIGASCPTGQVAVGGGARTMGPNGQPTRGNVMLQALVPGATTYAAQAVEKVGGYSGNWSLTAYVVCADADPDLELEIEGRTSDATPYFDPEQGWVNDVAAPCDAGKKLLGLGGVVGGPAGRVSFQQVRPNQQGAYAFVQGVRQSSFTDNFVVTAYAICARPVQGWRVEIDGTDYNTERVQTATATCDADEQIVAAGLTKGDVHGFAHVDAIIPSTLAGNLFTSAGIPDPTATYPWNLASWAVCVDV